MPKAKYTVGTAAFLTATVVFLSYLPVLENSFVNWDDTERIVRCAPIRSLSPESIRWMFTNLTGSYWMPLTWFSFALDFSMRGLNPRMFHLTNIVLHALNAALVFLVCLKVLVLARGGHETAEPSRSGSLEIPAALLTALLFGLHPIHVESVAWATERKDVLYAFFYLAAFLLYLDYATRPTRKGLKYAACLGCFLLSVMSKPMAVTLPFVFLIADAWPLGRLQDRLGKVLAEKIPFLALILPIGLVTFQAPAHTKAFLMTEGFPIVFRIVHACRSLVFYLWKMMAPVNLVPLYPFPRVRDAVYWTENFLALSVVVLIFAACFYYRKKAPYLAAAWLFYVVTLLPVLGIIQAGSQAAADRFTYLPSLSVFLLFSALLSHRFSDWKVLFVSAGVVLSILLGMMAVKQMGIWKDSQTLWESVLRVYPDETHFAHSNLASFYADTGRLPEALGEYERAIAIPPPWAQAVAMAGKAAVLADMRKESEAEQELRRALILDPRCVLAHQNLWVLYGRKGKYGEAWEEIRKAIEINPADPENHSKLGMICVYLGKWDQAIDAYSKCIELNPFEPGYYVNLGNLLVRRGRYPRAVEVFLSARQLQPQNPDITLLLAQACEKAGMIHQADQYYVEARMLSGKTRP